MADNLPKLRVTDPNNTSTSPIPSPTNYPQSPASADASSENLTRPLSQQQNPTNGKSHTRTTSTAKENLSLAHTNSADAEDGISATIDPLSQHILQRTKTGATTIERLKSPTETSLPRPSTRDGQEGKGSSEVTRTDSFGNANREKKKGVSFLSRFIGGNKKKAEGVAESEIEVGDAERQEGNDAELFSQPIDNLGFLPRHPQPPAYIKIRARYKKEKEFDRVFLAQELQTRQASKKAEPGNAVGGNPVWALEFSRDGKYLAAGGQDKILRVWTVISSPEERRAHEKEEAAAGQAEHLSAPVFVKDAVRQYEGHTSTILDLSWSKNNFLLSSSMDKTVRLWHISRSECLCTFKHADFVPSIQFHPKDDRFFLAGSLDTKLRLWSIPDKNVAYWTQLPDMITAVSFTPDGKQAIAGTLNGLCQFYETEGLKYQTQMHVKSTHGRNAKGSKITGIRTIDVNNKSTSEVKVLISSNDSRIRLYHLRDKSLETKFKGHENNQSQIRASFSDDGNYVICGSEDRKAYLFSTGPSESEKRNQQPVEVFDAHSTITTCAVLAPTSSRQLLSHSEDPVYDICNPPPVTLISKAESVASSRPGSVHATPTESTFKKAEESPAYIARSMHMDGNIIVTSDYSGNIKVFRQDCAFQKRRNDSWETSSVFSKKVGSRTMSIATRGSGRSRRDSTSTQPPNDRIMSWRNNVDPKASADNLSLRNMTRSKNRSISPRKSLASMRSPRPDSISTPELTQGSTSSRNNTPKAQAHENDMGFDNERNPLWIQDKQSNAFWNTQVIKEQMDRTHLERPPLSQRASNVSAVSALSSEMESVYALSNTNTRDSRR